MINLGFDIDHEPFTEGIVDDALKSTRETEHNIHAGVRTASNAEKKYIGKTSDSVHKLDTSLQNRRVNNSSIIARARNSVLQFPIYVSQSIRINEAQIIAGLFERVYTTFVQTVLSQNKIIDEDEANNLVFLKNFHSNIKEAADVLTNKYYEPIDDIDAMMCESVFYSQKLTENCTVDFSVVPATNKDLLAENARLLNEPLTGFPYLKESSESTSNSIAEKSTSAKFDPLSEADLKDIACERSNIDRNTRRQADMTDEQIEKSVKAEYHGRSEDEINKAISDALHAHKGYQNQIDDAVEELKNDIKAGNVQGLEYRNGKYCRKNTSTTSTSRNSSSVSVKTTDKPPIDAPKLLRDADIKKINNLTPYTMEATFRIKQKDGTLTSDVRYIIGVKSVLHLIRAQDLTEDLDEIITGNIRALQKVKYKTGEISFKDYFLNLKGIKADAMKNLNYNKRWINTLKRLAEYNKLNGSLLKQPAENLVDGKVPIPNGTLILSQLDVNNMVNETGIDVSDVNIATKLARSLFLIAVVIVDSTAGSMRILFPDSASDWDVQSLASIDAELSKTDNSSLMKELNKMVNK